MPVAYPEWKRLNEILEVVTAEGFDKLEADEIIEFGKLYRRAAAELAFHRTHDADPARVKYLNELVGRCYAYVYVAPRKPWPSVTRFFTTDFPRAIRRHAGLIILATLISLIPAVIGYLFTVHDRAVADQVLPPEFQSMLDMLVARHHTPKDWLPLFQRAPSAGFIMQNNIKISIMAFAGGMTLGLWTIFLLIYNGVMLGIVGAALVVDTPATTLNLLGFLLPHGVFELTAIFISGGAGFVLAYAIINPGPYPRRIALRMAGKEALTLMLGVVAMLVVAGLIEGFFSPMDIAEEIKLTVAAIEFVLLFGYFIFAGRNRRTSDEREPPFGKLMTPLPPV